MSGEIDLTISTLVHVPFIQANLVRITVPLPNYPIRGGRSWRDKAVICLGPIVFLFGWFHKGLYCPRFGAQDSVILLGII